MSDQKPELSVVMPVYNEEALIAQVIEEWTTCLEQQQIDYEFLVYDDGSRDRTRERLERAKEILSRLTVRWHANRGHGPTLLRGYREAQGKWILQVDSDGEIPSENFELLWEYRLDHDFLVGQRTGRTQSMARRILTRGTGAVVGFFFGSCVKDVNCPLRLMRRDKFIHLFSLLPEDIFAPNAVLSGLAFQEGLRIFQCQVKAQDRRAGKSSLTHLRIVSGAWRAFFQTASVGIRAGRERR